MPVILPRAEDMSDQGYSFSCVVLVSLSQLHFLHVVRQKTRVNESVFSLEY